MIRSSSILGRSHNRKFTFFPAVLLFSSKASDSVFSELLLFDRLPEEMKPPSGIEASVFLFLKGEGLGLDSYPGKRVYTPFSICKIRLLALAN